jgi:alpha-galactosidase
MTLRDQSPTQIGSGVVQLRAAGVGVAVDVSGPGVPAVVHWGADLGDQLPDLALLRPARPNSTVDQTVPLTLLAGAVGGDQHRPAFRGGPVWASDWRLHGVEQDGNRLRITCVSDRAGLRLVTDLDLDDHGVLRAAHELTNAGASPYRVDQLVVALPVAAPATELLDLTGKWARERQPQRVPFAAQGTWLRETRRGRTGFDAPLLLVAGTPAFGNRHGEVWGLHLAWSGDHQAYAERRPDGRSVLASGELLAADEVVLAPGESYRTPDVLAVWSDAGLDGLSDRLHRHVRARPSHPRRPRPAVLNTWEAVYFDHRLDRLTELADAAAEVGIERFVLDDGWFLGRRNDHAGLGDWVVDPAVWPDGLTPLVAHVRGLGMEFGLWVEPEMVNEDSELFRAHPDWVLRADPAGELPPPWRHQQVLDLTVPGAFDHVLGQLDALLSRDDIAYLKWDHNRDLIDAGHDGRPAVHAQTLAVYRLLDELRRRHPDVEIESCSSGGARVDLGILARTDRVWGSDTNDALERQTIQRWTQLLLPPELVGSHVGPATAHTSGRTHALSFRGATALFGHFGVEWDVSALGPDERAALGRLVSSYKRHRGLLHSGDVVHGDHPDPSVLVHGVVAADRGEALVAVVSTGTSAAETPVPVRLPGLDRDAAYRVALVDTGGPVLTGHRAPPGWWPADGAPGHADGPVLPGSVLTEMGLPLPVVWPEQAFVLHLSRA